jgi:hypothetical protein
MVSLRAGETVHQIGIILVHGIGEQQRFEHLDGQTRYLIDALKRASEAVDDVTVTINSEGAAGFKAQSDTWAAGHKPSVTICVHHQLGGSWRWSRLQIHEVWWADINEPYSVAKQIRFWLWAITIWGHPGQLTSGLPTASRVVPPSVTPDAKRLTRGILYGIGVLLMLVGMSIGLVTVVLSRLMNLQTPRILQVVTNYMSAIKLYNQKTRLGTGLWWPKEDFLDSVGDPPRVSIRRRMIRTIADVASNGYDRWYILAHSLGSLVALNGLMETAYSWPGYLDEPRWDRLVARHFAGPLIEGSEIPEGETRPKRPAWVAENTIAYRSRLFERFSGLLTYGSPLDKFAAIWPAVVPISREPAFHARAEWFNLYDPMDPIAGPIEAYSSQPEDCCPRPTDVAYCASPWLLLAHLMYLTSRGAGDAANATIRWILTEDSDGFRSGPAGSRAGTWLKDEQSVRDRLLRRALPSWLLVIAALAIGAALIAPTGFRWIATGLSSLLASLLQHLGIHSPPSLSLDWHPWPWLEAVVQGIDWLWGVWSIRAVLFIGIAMLVTWIAGAIAGRYLFLTQAEKDADKRRAAKHTTDPGYRLVRSGSQWRLPTQEPPRNGPPGATGNRPQGTNQGFVSGTQTDTFEA